MNDSTILYAGMFCFSMLLMGLALTMYEFKKTSSAEGKRSKRIDTEVQPLALSKVRIV